MATELQPQLISLSPGITSSDDQGDKGGQVLLGLGEPVSVARVRPVRNRGLLENHFPSEAVCLILTLTRLDYKSNLSHWLYWLRCLLAYLSHAFDLRGFFSSPGGERYHCLHEVLFWCRIKRGGRLAAPRIHKRRQRRRLKDA